ncbi:MAG: HNH endonuclease signature motif containing protein [Bacteroidales bacterium]
MDKQISVNDFTIERQCEFKGRSYLVRDNGAILRNPKIEGRVSKLDNQWTFGRKNSKTGYMMLSNVRVHQIVATAFHGEAPEENMVIDHKDTNRCNNRPDNLAWVTRLENVLNNPITRKRIAIKCGSVENFLNNPANYRNKFGEPNLSWMCTVSRKDATNCKRNLERWAKVDNNMSQLQGKGLGDWIFKDEEASNNDSFNTIWNKKTYGLKESLTENAMQQNWKITTEFPLCPKNASKNALKDYLNKIHEGKLFCKNDVYESIAYISELSEDNNILAVITSSNNVKKYSLTTVTFDNGKYIHYNKGSFFEEIGAIKYMTLELGKDWTGGDVFDDQC